MTETEDKKILAQWSETILEIPGVTGVGTASKHILITVAKMDPKTLAAIPTQIEGKPVKIIQAGPFHFLQTRTDKWRPCITKDSIILANPSPKTLEELKEGEYVYSLDDSCRLVKRRLVKKICSGVKPVYRLKTYGHEIEATEDHPFLVYSGRKWWYERNKKGQYRGRRSAVYLEWKSLRELKPGDLIATYRSIPDGKGVVPRELNSFSREFFVIVGAFLGDGFLMHWEKKNHGKPYDGGIMLAIPKGDKSRAKYEELCRRVFGKVSAKRYLKVYSAETARLFRKLDLSHPAKEKHIPDWVFALPRALKEAVVEGLCDTDGYRRNSVKGERRKGYVYCSASKRLVQDLKILLEMMGCQVSRVMKREQNSTLPQGRLHKSVAYSIEWVEGRCKPTTFRDLHNGLIRLKRGDVTFTRVKSIEFAGEKEVWDLEIEGTHNFIANGLVVHNCPGGVSIGHFKVTAGTLACMVKDAKTGEVKLLSNNHVFALDIGDIKIGQKGDPILQPGPADGGTLDDKVGELDRWLRVYSPDEEGQPSAGKGFNIIDAALASTTPELVKPEVLDIGKPVEPVEAKVGQKVRKSGRTTALTYGTVASSDYIVDVYYTETEYCRFKDTIFVQPPYPLVFAQPGDSGSLTTLATSTNPVGLVFAGDEAGNGVLCKATYITALLDVEFLPSLPYIPVASFLASYSFTAGIASYFIPRKVSF